MALFDDVFNKANIYETLFFNIKAVLIYPTLKELEEKNKPLFESWKLISKLKYGVDVHNASSKKTVSISTDINNPEIKTVFEYYSKDNDVYETNAPYYPEFNKIVTISYATVYLENGDLKRYFKICSNNDEHIVISTFIDVLNQLSIDGSKSNPQYFPTLCGHNIINYDIPLLIKRFILNKDKIELNKEIPYILKRVLIIKPWESGIIDTVNVWKFNGYDNLYNNANGLADSILMLITNYLNLKRKVDLMPINELSKYYWTNVNEKPTETLDFIALQSSTQTNLVIQLINELRKLTK